MRRKTVSTIWAVFCTIALVAGETLAFFFAWQKGTWVAIAEIVGFVLGCIFAPIVHECGHIFFAKKQNMAIVYAKFFCFKIVRMGSKKRFSIASPFISDETQVIPKTGGDMQKRACWYTIGGLLFSGIFLFILTALAIVFFFTINAVFAYAFFGVIPYVAYLFFLNALPFEYAGGKTDALVYQGLKKGEPAEKNMLSAMEIQGRAFAGTSYAEMDEALFYDAPQLPEDEPLFAVMLDLRYRYWLDKGDMQKASDCLNRLALSHEYLSAIETEKVAGELVYMHSINGDLERAEECGKGCKGYLQEETATSKRILSEYALAVGKTDEARILKEQGEKLAQQEMIEGERKLALKLLSRIIAV